MFSETFSYYNTYSGTKRHHDASPAPAAADSVPSEDFPQKRRRLVDHLNSLNIGQQKHFKQHTNGIFGNIPSSGASAATGSNFNESPNKVFINNIDQFLRENPEKLDIIGSELTFDHELVGEDIFIDKKVLKSAWDKLVCDFNSNGNVSPIKDLLNKGTDIDSIVKNLIWKEYLVKYFSLIKYSNPLQLVWQSFLEWQDERMRGKDQIHELDMDGDEEMGGDNYNFGMTPVTSASSSLDDGTSNYGSYYGDEHPWDQQRQQFYPHQQYPQQYQMVVDEDICMD